MRPRQLGFGSEISYLLFVSKAHVLSSWPSNLPLTAKRIDTSPLWTFCSYFPSLLHYSLWIIFVFLIVFDTLAYSLVNDPKSGDHRLDSISGHYQSPDMNTHTRTFSHFLLKKTYFFARYEYTNWQTLFLHLLLKNAYCFANVYILPSLISVF